MTLISKLTNFGLYNQNLLYTLDPLAATVLAATPNLSLSWGRLSGQLNLTPLVATHPTPATPHSLGLLITVRASHSPLATSICRHPKCRTSPQPRSGSLNPPSSSRRVPQPYVPPSDAHSRLAQPHCYPLSCKLQTEYRK